MASKFSAPILAKQTQVELGLSLGEANHALKTAESLAYRQMISLALFENQSKLNHIPLRNSDYRESDSSISSDKISILQEIFQLNNLGLIDCRLRSQNTGNTGDLQEAQIIRGNNSKALLGWDDIEPKMMRLTTLGRKYHDLMDLHEIPEQDLEVIGKILGDTQADA